MSTVDDKRTRQVTAGNLLAALPNRLEAERFDSLLTQGNVRIERIVSTGHATPQDKWYDQTWDEWVLLVSGAATVLVEHEDTPRSLEPGDHLFLPAHVRHRVTWTAPDRPTVWLAVSIDGPTSGASRGAGRRR